MAIKHTPDLTVITNGQAFKRRKLPDIFDQTHNRPASFSLLYNKRADKPFASGDKCHKSAKGTRHNLGTKKTSRGMFGFGVLKRACWGPSLIMWVLPTRQIDILDRHVSWISHLVFANASSCKIPLKDTERNKTPRNHTTPMYGVSILRASSQEIYLGSSEMRHSPSAL